MTSAKEPTAAHSERGESDRGQGARRMKKRWKILIGFVVVIVGYVAWVSRPEFGDHAELTDTCAFPTITNAQYRALVAEAEALIEPRRRRSPTAPATWGKIPTIRRSGIWPRIREKEPINRRDVRSSPRSWASVGWAGRRCCACSTISGSFSFGMIGIPLIGNCRSPVCRSARVFKDHQGYFAGPPGHGSGRACLAVVTSLSVSAFRSMCPTARRRKRRWPDDIWSMREPAKACSSGR